MKQHISVEQLNELSKSAHDKWLDVLPTTKRFTDSTTASEESTIGQMIEFLLEKNNLPFDEDGSPVLPVYTDPISNEAICDELWATVKEVLDKDDV